MTAYLLFRAPLPIVLLLALFARETRSEVYAVGSGKPSPARAALPVLKPGDTVEIYPGVYREMRRWRESGTAERPIRLIGVGAPDSKIVAHNNIFTGSDWIVGENRGSVEGSHKWMPQTAHIPAGFRDNRTGEKPGFLMAGRDDFRIAGKSACAEGGVSDPRYLDFAGKPQSGIPASEYVPHLRLRPRPREGAPTIGAYSALRSETGVQKLSAMRRDRPSASLPGAAAAPAPSECRLQGAADARNPARRQGAGAAGRR